MSEGSKNAVYSIKEKLLLTQLVKENTIIENKKTDGATVAEKNRAWERLTTTYNSQPEVNIPRTQQQLRKLWNNLKQRKRKETTELRHDMLATGGGPMKVMKPDPVLKFVSEAAAGLDVTVNCPWDSTHLFERDGAGISSTSLENTTESQEAANKAIDELLFSGNSSAEPVPCTSKGTDARYFSDNTSTREEPATLSHAEAIVAMESTNSLCPTTPSKAVATKKGRVSSEAKNIRRNRLIEATHVEQEELQNLKQQIAKEELLRVKAETQQAAHRSDILQQIAELDLRRARLDHQRAADEAELASLKLKQFKKEMLSEGH